MQKYFASVHRLLVLLFDYFQAVNCKLIYVCIAISHWRHSGFGLFVCVFIRARSCTESVLVRYLANRLGEFHKIYNFGAVADKGELIAY